MTTIIWVLKGLASVVDFCLPQRSPRNQVIKIILVVDFRWVNWTSWKYFANLHLQLGKAKSGHHFLTSPLLDTDWTRAETVAQRDCLAMDSERASQWSYLFVLYFYWSSLDNSLFCWTPTALIFAFLLAQSFSKALASLWSVVLTELSYAFSLEFSNL